MDELLLGISSSSEVPHAKLSHLTNAEGDPGAGVGGGGGDAGAGSGAGAGAGDSGAGAGSDAGMGAGAGDAGVDTGDAGAGAGDAEQDFLNDPTGEGADTGVTAEGDEGTGAGEDIDPATGQPRVAQPGQQLTPEQQEQQRVEDETLKDFYASTPALKDFLKSNPTARAQFFKAAQINQIYSSVDDARMAADYASQLSSFDKLYTSSRPEDTKSFVDTMWEQSLQDPTKPFHPSANPSRGHFERLAASMTEVGFKGVLGNIDKAAQAVGLNPQQATRALEYVASMLGIKINGLNAIRGGQVQAPGQQGQISPQEQAIIDRENAINAREQAAATREQQAFATSVTESVTSHINAEITKALKPAEAVFARQPSFVQESIRKTIADRTVNAIQNDKPFQVRFDTAEARGDRGPQHAQELVNLMRARVNDELPRQAASVMREAGLSIVRNNQKVLDAKQAAAGKREVPANSSPGRLTQPGRTTPQRGNGAARTNAGQGGGSYEKFADNALKDFVENG